MCVVSHQKRMIFETSVKALNVSDWAVYLGGGQHCRKHSESQKRS